MGPRARRVVFGRQRARPCPCCRRLTRSNLTTHSCMLTSHTRPLLLPVHIAPHVLRWTASRYDSLLWVALGLRVGSMSCGSLGVSLPSLSCSNGSSGSSHFRIRTLHALPHSGVGWSFSRSRSCEQRLIPMRRQHLPLVPTAWTATTISFSLDGRPHRQEMVLRLRFSNQEVERTVRTIRRVIRWRRI